MMMWLFFGGNGGMVGGPPPLTTSSSSLESGPSLAVSLGSSFDTISRPFCFSRLQLDRPAAC
jgi:hypothetical protein